MRLIIVILFWSTGEEEIIDAILENILTNMNERFISRDSILLRSTSDNATSFLPSFGKMNPSLAFYFQSTWTRVHTFSFQSWHLYTWLIFRWKISRDRHLLFLLPRGKKRDTLNNIDDEYQRRSFTWLTSY